MNNPDQFPLLLRRSQVLEITGLPGEQFSKAVQAGVIAPVYLVWEVVARNGRVLLLAAETKARTEATKNGAKARPCGRAYYRRTDVLKLAAGPN